MKWLYNMVAALAISVAHASPMPQQQGDYLTVYNLRVTSSVSEVLNGKQLSVSNNSIGVWEDGGRPVQVYTVSSSRGRGLWELHTYPIGIVDAVVALIGDSDVRPLQEVSMPGANAEADWQAWNLVESGEKAGQLLWGHGVTGRWLAFPRRSAALKGWMITHVKESAIVTTDYMPVEVVFEKVK